MAINSCCRAGSKKLPAIGGAITPLIQTQLKLLQQAASARLKSASLFDMTVKQAAVFTAVQADNSAVPPLLFPTFTAVMR